MRTLLVLLSVLLAATATPADLSDIRGAKMLRVVPLTKDDLHHLHQLHLQGQYDFWMEPRAVGSPVDIMTSRTHLPELITFLERHGLKADERVSDVAQLVGEQMIGIYMRGSRTMDWMDYHDYDTINTWMASLASDYPDLCTLEEVGKSYEDRVMNLLTLGKGGADKPGIFLDGGMHAREWISPATVTYMVNELVTNSSAYDDLLSSINFYVMPVTNPDGYTYTFTTPSHRMWRKTRSVNGTAKCVGVDPNRNWNFHWREVDTSNNSCYETYGGPKAFSEVEMRVVRDQIMRLASNIKVYLSFHSYGQKWMYPWGYTTELPDDWQDLDKLAQAAVSALTAVHGTPYEIGTPGQTLYPASGGSLDWVKAVAGIKYTYVLELRDRSLRYFTLEGSEIIPCGEETLEALKVLAYFVKDTYSN